MQTDKVLLLRETMSGKRLRSLQCLSAGGQLPWGLAVELYLPAQTESWESKAGPDPLEGQGAKKKRQRILRTRIRHWIQPGLKLAPPEGSKVPQPAPFLCAVRKPASLTVTEPALPVCVCTSTSVVCNRHKAYCWRL